ncbi:MAG: 4Fe-4S dicluster domain-containing protein [Chloroflexi bacterium]|nr:4Fe-4S dicluster domain-containing protein [Chloroflexota bacterium]
MTQLAFFFDPARCTACGTCAVACKDWNNIPDGPVFWRRIETTEEGEFPEVHLQRLLRGCLHCARPACITACPVGAITKRAEDGVVLVDQERCVPHCYACWTACPYGAPQFGDDGRMQMCNFCPERLAEGAKPICVAACPLHALDAGPMDELVRTYGNGHWPAEYPDATAPLPSLIMTFE